MEMVNEKNKGAVIVEATISLSAFMFAIVMILFMCHVCYAQSKIGTVIDGVAKDLSEYSYIYSLTGLNKKQAVLSEQASAARADVDEICNNLNDVGNAVSSIGNFASKVAGDSEMQSSVIALVKNTGVEVGKSFLVGNVVKACAKSRLAGTSGTDAEMVLKNLGIQKTGGSYLGSIDFSDSVFCLNGGDEIKVVARYSVKLVKLLNTDITFDLCQCASTKAWAVAEAKAVEPVDDVDKKDDKDDKDDKEDEEQEEKPQENAGDLAKKGTHNSASSQVMLGDGSQASEAERMSMTYFKMPTDGSADLYDEWTVTKEFLSQQQAAGKTFYLNKNPNTATGTYAKQVQWLKEQGYTFKKNPMGFWTAEK